MLNAGLFSQYLHQFMLMQGHKKAAAAAVSADVYVVGKPFNRKLSLAVATELQPEVSGLQKFFSKLGGKKEVPTPAVQFEIPYQGGCFCVILESKCEECCLLNVSLPSCINT